MGKNILYKRHPCSHTIECFKYSELFILGRIFCVPVCAGNKGRKAGTKPASLRFTYLSQQTPGVFTKVWTDGCQEQSLSLYKLEDQVSVHSLNRQLTVLIFGCLQNHTEMGQRSSSVGKTRQFSQISFKAQKKVFHLELKEASFQSLFKHHLLIVLLRLQDASIHLTTQHTESNVAQLKSESD